MRLNAVFYLPCLCSVDLSFTCAFILQLSWAFLLATNSMQSPLITFVLVHKSRAVPWACPTVCRAHSDCWHASWGNFSLCLFFLPGNLGHNFEDSLCQGFFPHVILSASTLLGEKKRPFSQKSARLWCFTCSG